NGPFPLYPVNVADRGKVVIQSLETAQEKSPPLVVLYPPQDDSATSFLKFSNTSLDLRHVHLGLDASAFSTEPDDALIHVDAGDLYLQNCSISVKGATGSPLAACKVTGQVKRTGPAADKQTRVLIQKTVVRGNSLTALLCDLPASDIVIHQSLLWSGS